MNLFGVPWGFWVALAVILAVGGAVGLVMRARLRSGVWRWRYQPEHVRLDRPTLTPGKQTFDFLPAAVTAVQYTVVAGKPPWEVAHEPEPEDWTGELLADLQAPGQRPRGMTEPPEDLGPGAGMTDAGYNSHLPSVPDAKMDSPAPVPTRLASAADVALARCDAFMVAMRADHERWLAAARERWAAA